MSEYRRTLLADLGGADSLSAMELSIVETCVKDYVILQTVDNFLLQAGLFNRKKHAAYALTTQSSTITALLTNRLYDLGFKRRAKPVQTLADLLKSRPEPITEAVDDTLNVGLPVKAD